MDEIDGAIQDIHKFIHVVGCARTYFLAEPDDLGDDEEADVMSPVSLVIEDE